MAAEDVCSLFFFFCSEKDATPHCVTAVPLCTFPSKAAIQHAPCLLPSYKNSFERNAFAWIESSLTWEVELADPVAYTAKEDDPGNCRCPCVSGRPLNQVIWLTVFAAICLGLLWWRSEESPSKTEVSGLRWWSFTSPPRGREALACQRSTKRKTHLNSCLAIAFVC